MKKLPEKIQDAMKSLWGLQNKTFKYKPSFIFSELKAERDNIPKKAHMDYNPNVMKWESGKGKKLQLLFMCWHDTHSCRWMHDFGVDRRIKEEGQDC